MNHYFYSRQYFHHRDHLDLHIAHALKIFCRDHNLKKILDIGCGTGKLVDFLNFHGFAATGCDKYFSAKNIIRADAAKLPFPSRSFDLITAISVVEHLSLTKADRFLAESFRVLRPTGHIFLITPNFASPFRAIRKSDWFAYSDPTHIHYFTPQSLTQALVGHGFIHPRLRFKIDRTVKFDWHLPAILRPLPAWVKYFLTFLLISSPLSLMRDSFWISARKSA